MPRGKKKPSPQHEFPDLLYVQLDYDGEDRYYLPEDDESLLNADKLVALYRLDKLARVEKRTTLVEVEE